MAFDLGILSAVARAANGNLSTRQMCADVEPIRRRQAGSGAGGRLLLLVSEDERQRALLHAYLQHVGFEVISCADPETALRMADEACPVDLLLIDAQLLGAGGRQLRESLTERCPDLPVLIISCAGMRKGALRQIKHCIWDSKSEAPAPPGWLVGLEESNDKQSMPEAREEAAAGITYPDQAVAAIPDGRPPAEKELHFVVDRGRRTLLRGRF
ncbi:MAG TPA: response regulator [Terracidiphilus sp.]|nr:response regulator [Terracidiphilus sp.]